MMKNNSTITAVLLIAVIFIGNSLTGCVTSRHIDELKAEHRELKKQVDDTQGKVDKMESVIVEGADASKKLRNDLSISSDEFQTQMGVLLENYNNLLRIVQEINATVHSKKTLIGSVPGGTVVQDPATNELPVMPKQPAFDCGNLYDEAFIAFRQVEEEKYNNAISLFEDFIDKCPDHASAPNAHYWVGEAFYAMQKYVDAVSKFEYLLEKYKGSVNTNRAMYKLGRSKQELGKNSEAKKMFERLIDEYPETLEASQAKDRLKDLD